MKILIDLQSCQTQGSKNRGIGRYSDSLTRAILKNKGEHEVFIFISSVYEKEIAEIKKSFNEIIPEDHIIIWNARDDLDYLSGNKIKQKQAILSRALYIKSVSPDIVLVTSLFEGLSESATVSTELGNANIPVATILYDLIPYLNKEIYLKEILVKNWYEDKIEDLKKSDLLLSISESSRLEGIDYLNVNPEKVVNISTASNSCFKKEKYSEKSKKETFTKYNVNKKYILYTGGVDHRKNIEALIEAYSLLPSKIKENHQLAIVCHINKSTEILLTHVLMKYKIKKDDVVFTGFVTDDELNLFYNECDLFVFPSWHEGFGLPVLEALNCGAVVIASNCSSLPEVLGFEESFFDPHNTKDMAEKMHDALTNNEYRQRAITHAKEQVKLFSWDKSANSAISAMQKLIKENELINNSICLEDEKLSLAFLTPLPPQKSGISQYSYLLISELKKYYNITLVLYPRSKNVSFEGFKTISTDEFEKTYESFDRVIYQIGNSEFHSHMYKLSLDYPGIVVLHDFYLGGLINFTELQTTESVTFETELFYSHPTVKYSSNRIDLLMKYPCSKHIIDSAIRVIVHSEHSFELAHYWYGKPSTDNWDLIPLLRTPNKDIKGNERERLNFPSNAFITTTFGHLGESKLNVELLEAWLSTSLSKQSNTYLVFAGEASNSNYCDELITKIKNSFCSDRILVTGWIDDETYEDYLKATDIAVQLRKDTRGETSAAALDCLGYGIPLIVNAHGSMKYIDDSAVYKIQDNFSQSELLDSLEYLFLDEKKRIELAQKGCEMIQNEHSVENAALLYMKSIEKGYSKWELKEKNDKFILNNRSNIFLKQISKPVLVNITKFPKLKFFLIKMIRKSERLSRIVEHILR